MDVFSVASTRPPEGGEATALGQEWHFRGLFSCDQQLFGCDQLVASLLDQLWLQRLWTQLFRGCAFWLSTVADFGIGGL
jgi:hypothetical protein